MVREREELMINCLDNKKLLYHLYSPRIIVYIDNLCTCISPWAVSTLVIHTYGFLKINIMYYTCTCTCMLNFVIYVCVTCFFIIRGDKKVICNKIILQVRKNKCSKQTLKFSVYYIMVFILIIINPLECCHYTDLACTATNLYIWFSRW